MQRNLGFLCLLGAMVSAGCTGNLNIGATSDSGEAAAQDTNHTAPDEMFPCTKEGVREAMTHGSAPYMFDCNSSTIVPDAATLALVYTVLVENVPEPDGNADHLSVVE